MLELHWNMIGRLLVTLDRRHFSLYRPGRRRRFAIVPG